MTAEQTPTVWVPTCCGRVMRYNTFRLPEGGAYGALVCTVCNKNINLEQEPAAAVKTYGEGASVLSVVGSPRPPNVERKKGRDAFTKADSDEPTL
jgi:hypothetical protein